MSFDEELKDAFARHASDVQPSDETWPHITKGVKRARARRVALVGTFTALAIASAAVAVPKLVGNGSNNGSHFVTPGETESPAPSIRADQAVYRDEISGFQIVYPKAWRDSIFEGHTEIQPKDVPALETGAPTFAIDISHGAKAVGPENANTSINGRPAIRTEETTPSGSHTITYTVSRWDDHACPPNQHCASWQGEPFVLKITAGTDALWTRLGETGEEIAHSLRMTWAAGPPEGVDVYTRHGRVDKAITWDGATREFVAFLDSRVEGGGAEVWLTKEAKAQFETGGPLSLYNVPHSTSPWLSWRLPTSSQNAGESTTFTVMMISRTSSGDPRDLCATGQQEVDVVDTRGGGLEIVKSADATYGFGCVADSMGTPSP